MAACCCCADIIGCAHVLDSVWCDPSGMHGPAHMICLMKQVRVHALTHPALSTPPPPFDNQAIEEGGVHWSKRVMVPNFVRADLWDISTEAEAAVGAPQQDEPLPLPAEPPSLPLPTPLQDLVPSGPVRRDEAAGSFAAAARSPPVQPSQGSTAAVWELGCRSVLICTRTAIPMVYCCCWELGCRSVVICTHTAIPRVYCCCWELGGRSVLIRTAIPRVYCRWGQQRRQQPSAL